MHADCSEASGLAGATQGGVVDQGDQSWRGEEGCGGRRGPGRVAPAPAPLLSLLVGSERPEGISVEEAMVTRTQLLEEELSSVKEELALCQVSTLWPPAFPSTAGPCPALAAAGVCTQQPRRWRSLRAPIHKHFPPALVLEGPGGARLPDPLLALAWCSLGLGCLDLNGSANPQSLPSASPPPKLKFLRATPLVLGAAGPLLCNSQVEALEQESNLH